MPPLETGGLGPSLRPAFVSLPAPLAVVRHRCLVAGEGPEPDPHPQPESKDSRHQKAAAAGEPIGRAVYLRHLEEMAWSE